MSDAAEHSYETCPNVAAGMNALTVGGSLHAMPPHVVVERGLNPIGQLFVKVEYSCGCRDIIDPMTEAEYGETEASESMNFTTESGDGDESP